MMRAIATGTALFLAATTALGQASSTTYSVDEATLYEVDMVGGVYTAVAPLQGVAANFDCRDLAILDGVLFCAIRGDLYRIPLADHTPQLLSSNAAITSSGVVVDGSGALWFLGQEGDGGPTSLSRLDPVDGSVVDEAAITTAGEVAEGLAFLHDRAFVVSLDDDESVPAYIQELDPVTGLVLATYEYDPQYSSDILAVDAAFDEAGRLWIGQLHVTGIITAPAWTTYRRVTLHPFEVVETWSGVGGIQHPRLSDIALVVQGSPTAIPTLGGWSAAGLAALLALLAAITMRRRLVVSEFPHRASKKRVT